MNLNKEYKLIVKFNPNLDYNQILAAVKRVLEKKTVIQKTDVRNSCIRTDVRYFLFCCCCLEKFEKYKYFLNQTKNDTAWLQRQI